MRRGMCTPHEKRVHTKAWICEFCIRISFSCKNWKTPVFRIEAHFLRPGSEKPAEVHRTIKNGSCLAFRAKLLYSDCSPSIGRNAIRFIQCAKTILPYELTSFERFPERLHRRTYIQGNPGCWKDLCMSRFPYLPRNLSISRLLDLQNALCGHDIAECIFLL